MLNKVGHVEEVFASTIYSSEEIGVEYIQSLVVKHQVVVGADNYLTSGIVVGGEEYFRGLNILVIREDRCQFLQQRLVSNINAALG